MIFQEPMRRMNVGCRITMNDHVGGGMGGGIKDVVRSTDVTISRSKECEDIQQPIISNGCL